MTSLARVFSEVLQSAVASGRVRLIRIERASSAGPTDDPSARDVSTDYRLNRREREGIMGGEKEGWRKGDASLKI